MWRAWDAGPATGRCATGSSSFFTSDTRLCRSVSSILAGAIVFPLSIPVSAGIHAWTVGAIGTMTLAIMTCATLGHAGQPLTAGPLTHAIYFAIVVAALVRIAATFAVGLTAALLYAAGAAWIAAFWMFVIGYGPLLSRPRKTVRQ